MKRAIFATVLCGAILAPTILAQERGHRFFKPPRATFFRNPILYPPIRDSLHFRHYPGYYVRGYCTPHDGLYGSQGDPRSYEGGVHRIYLQTPIVGGEVVRANHSDIVFNVDPPKALIFVDGKLIGSARDFASERDSYSLIEGEYELRIEFPGFKPFISRMDIVSNKTLHLDIELEEEP